MLAGTLALSLGCGPHTSAVDRGRDAPVSSLIAGDCNGIEIRDAQDHVRVLRKAQRWSGQAPPWEDLPDWQAACRGATFYTAGRRPEFIGLCEREGQILAIVVMSQLASSGDPNHAHFGTTTVHTSSMRNLETSRCARIEADTMLEPKARAFTVTGEHWLSVGGPLLSVTIRGAIALQ